MREFIGCFPLLAIIGFLAWLIRWSNGKRKGVEEFYKIHSLFSASDAPPLVRQAIGNANVFCLKGVSATAAGDEVPFFWWEWSSTSTVQGGTGPQSAVSCFLAISFPPDTVSDTFERYARQTAQSNHTWPQKFKEAFMLNTRDPKRTEKLQDGSFIIFWQVLQRPEVMEAKLAWLKSNLSVKSPDADSVDLIDSNPSTPTPTPTPAPTPTRTPTSNDWKVQLLNKASLAITQGDNKTATAAYSDLAAGYSDLIALEPTVAEHYYDRGWAYYTLEQLDLAMADFNKAIELNFISAYSYLYRGIVLCDLKQPERALADANKFIELHPEKSDGYNLRGKAYQALGRETEAQLDFDKEKELAKADLTSKAAYARHDGDEDTAAAIYSDLIALEPTVAQSYYDRGWAYRTLGEHELALADYTKIIELDPTSAAAYLYRGFVHLNLKQPGRALADASSYIDLKPGDSDGYNLRGRAYQALGRESDAQLDFDKEKEIRGVMTR